MEREDLYNSLGVYLNSVAWSPLRGEQGFNPAPQLVVTIKL